MKYGIKQKKKKISRVLAGFLSYVDSTTTEIFSEIQLYLSNFITIRRMVFVVKLQIRQKTIPTQKFHYLISSRYRVKEDLVKIETLLTLICKDKLGAHNSIRNNSLHSAVEIIVFSFIERRFCTFFVHSILLRLSENKMFGSEFHSYSRATFLINIPNIFHCVFLLSLSIFPFNSRHKEDDGIKMFFFFLFSQRGGIDRNQQLLEIFRY